MNVKSLPVEQYNYGCKHVKRACNLVCIGGGNKNANGSVDPYLVTGHSICKRDGWNDLVLIHEYTHVAFKRRKDAVNWCKEHKFNYTYDWEIFTDHCEDKVPTKILQTLACTRWQSERTLKERFNMNHGQSMSLSEFMVLCGAKGIKWFRLTYAYDKRGYNQERRDMYDPTCLERELRYLCEDLTYKQQVDDSPLMIKFELYLIDISNLIKCHSISTVCQDLKVRIRDRWRNTFEITNGDDVKIELEMLDDILIKKLKKYAKNAPMLDLKDFFETLEKLNSEHHSKGAFPPV